ncbi:hypothetical protein M569_06869, partial [Genlisea aurea]
MTAEVANGFVDAVSQPHGDLKSQNAGSITSKQSREIERRRRRRKQKKNKKHQDAAEGDESDTVVENSNGSSDNGLEPVVVEYVPEKAELDGILDEAFRKVFEKFNFHENAAAEETDKKDENAADAASKKKSDSDSDDEEQDAPQKDKGVSNKKKKLQRRMKIAELKQISTRPDVVEVWDATASDPKLLVYLKSYRNTVAVPRHWCQKRKFLQGSCCCTNGALTCRCLQGGSLRPFFCLSSWGGSNISCLGKLLIYFSTSVIDFQGKRGIEKQPFQLPDFIAATGIEKIRQVSFIAYIEKEDSKKLKQKQRERMQPKMGKMDIDYQVLHDAFFKHQTKPKLTTHGDLYYEGKEFEVKLREMKPGLLSHDLKEALGMPEGAPPPWLINMQRYGPPPSYPHLKIPGLNSPIPPGAKFGYGHGDWGKPPVDEFGRPLYGDVFGVLQQDKPNYEEEPVDKSKHWGDLEEEEEEEEEEEQEEEDQVEEEELQDGIKSVDSLSRFFSCNCFLRFSHRGFYSSRIYIYACLSLSTPTGVETPDVIDLRKQQRKEPDRPLYQVLEEKEEKIAPGTLLAPSHTYLINTGAQEKAGAKRVN